MNREQRRAKLNGQKRLIDYMTEEEVEQYNKDNQIINEVNVRMKALSEKVGARVIAEKTKGVKN